MNNINNQLRYSSEYEKKMDILKKIYNIQTKTKLFEHIIDLIILQNWGIEKLESILEKNNF